MVNEHVVIMAKTFQFLINIVQAFKLAKLRVLLLARNSILDISDSLNCPMGQSFSTFDPKNDIPFASLMISCG